MAMSLIQTVAGQLWAVPAQLELHWGQGTGVEQTEKTVLPSTKHSQVPIFSLLSSSHTFPLRLTVNSEEFQYAQRGGTHSFRGISPNRGHAV